MISSYMTIVVINDVICAGIVRILQAFQKVAMNPEMETRHIEDLDQATVNDFSSDGQKQFNES